MTTEKKTSLAVAALKNGTVIDHIPASSLFTAAKILGVEHLGTQLTIGNNLESRQYGKKGIIKVADTYFPEATLNRIAIIAPNAKVNIIRDYEVVEKHQVSLPDTLTDIVKCANPKCITNNEPMHTIFEVVDREHVKLKCHYCNHVIDSSEAVTL